jgi:hypothetical protein
VESPTAIAQRQIRQFVADYTAALNARNLNEVGRLFPTMPRVEREGWQALFDQRNARDLRITWRVDNIDLSGSTATVRVNGETQFMQQSPRKACRLPVSLNLKVTNASGSWRLTDIQQLNAASAC